MHHHCPVLMIGILGGLNKLKLFTRFVHFYFCAYLAESYSFVILRGSLHYYIPKGPERLTLRSLALVCGLVGEAGDGVVPSVSREP